MIHVAGGVFSGGVVRDEGIEARNPDLVVGNGANDGGSRGRVHMTATGSRNRDLDRHGDAARDKQPPLELGLVYPVVLADRGNPTIDLVLVPSSALWYQARQRTTGCSPRGAARCRWR